MSGTRYRVVHRTEYRYGATMLDGYSVACLLARDTPSQRVASTTVTTDPDPDERDEHQDVFGNTIVQVGLHQPHEGLVVEAVSDVTLWSPQMPHDDMPWERVAGTVAAARGNDALDVSPFAASSCFVPLATQWAMLHDVAAPSFAPGRPVVEAVSALCRDIYETYTFDPAFTEVSTPLDVVVAERRGVCQDFAHLAVGAMRAVGLAVRYVSGYLETDPPPGEQRMVGADASHAWCSVWIPGHGWLDVDPTNGLVAPDRHITVAWGRDYADVTPVRGVVIGPSSSQSLTVSVDVEATQ